MARTETVLPKYCFFGGSGVISPNRDLTTLRERLDERAKPLKSGDAKLQGLRLSPSATTASYRSEKL